MFMPLLSPAAGTLHHVLPEGSLLNAGDLIAKCAAISPMKQAARARDTLLPGLSAVG